MVMKRGWGVSIAVSEPFASKLIAGEVTPKDKYRHLPSARHPVRLPVAKNLLLDSLDEPAGLLDKLGGLLPPEIRKCFVVGFAFCRLRGGKDASDLVGHLSGLGEMVAETSNNTRVGVGAFSFGQKRGPRGLKDGVVSPVDRRFR